jgi:paraquat-inducible protein B
VIKDKEKSMKQATLLTLVLILGTGLGAQEEIAALFRGVELTSQEREAIRQTIVETQEVIARAQVEMNFHKAQLERLLFDINVSEAEVEELMKQTLEWRLQSEMARLRRRIRLRKILGDERWAQVVRRFQRLEREGLVGTQGNQGWGQ